MNDKSEAIFRDAPIPKAVLSNILPSMIAMVMVLIYNLADTFFIGQTNDPLMVAAISISTPVFMLFMSVGMLFGIGGTSLISRLLGEGKRDDIKHVSSFCFWTSAVIGVICMVGVWLCIDPLARISGASDNTIGFTMDYFKIVAFSIPFLIISNAFSSILRAEGKAQKAMIGMIIGNLVNIVLDPIMILGLGWGVSGAAFATVIGNVAAGIFYIAHMCSKNTILSIKIKDYKVNKTIVLGVLSIGIPASIMNLSMSLSNILANNKMMNFGDMAMAGFGVAMKVNMMVIMLLIGLGTGIQPLLGYCFGAKNKERFMGCMKFSMIIAFSISMVMSILCYIFAGNIVNLFLNEPNAYTFGVEFARIYLYSGPVIGIFFVLMNAIQATGSGTASLILSLSRQGIFYIPTLFILNKAVHTPGILAATQPIADYLSFFLCIILLTVVMKKGFSTEQRLGNSLTA